MISGGNCRKAGVVMLPHADQRKAFCTIYGQLAPCLLAKILPLPHVQGTRSAFCEQKETDHSDDTNYGKQTDASTASL